MTAVRPNRPSAEGGGSRAGVSWGCSHPPGLALKGAEQAPTLLQRMQILSHLAHLGDEFTLLDTHKPLCAITDVGCSLLLSLCPVLQCLAVTARHRSLGW